MFCLRNYPMTQISGLQKDKGAKKMMKRFGKSLSILLALALAFTCIAGLCTAAEEEPPQGLADEAAAADSSGTAAETVSGAEAAAEAVFGEKVPETGGTGEETAAETEKTEASSEGMPLEEATEQPSGTEGDGIPENPAEDSPETEKEDGEAADQPSESVSGSEKEPKENHADKPEDEPADEPEDIGTVLNLNGCKTVSGILTGEAPFSVKASDDYSRIVVFTLTEPEEKRISVLMDDQPVPLTRIDNENPDDTDCRCTFEVPLLAGRDYTITLQAETGGEIPFTLSIRKKPDENPEEAVPELPEDETDQEENGEEEIPESPEDAADPEGSGEEADFGPEDGENRFPDDFAIHFNASWEGEELHFGDTAHFYVTAEGDDGIDYYIVWQWSEDNENWNTVEDENGKELDLTVTEENYLWYWRIKAKLREQD